MMENKFEIVFTNGAEQRNESIDNILISSNNPRFTLIKNINDNLLKKIANTNINQDQTIKNLLMCEGDFSDLVNLLQSIDDSGWVNNEHVYVVRHHNDQSKFVVAEGNRRMLAIKLLSGKFKLPQYSELCNKQNNYSNDNTEKRELSSDNELTEEEQRGKTLQNYKEVERLIKDFKFDNDKNYKICAEIINNDDTLWNQIYNKHLTGEKRGMRKWSRSKYFADLVSFFKDGFNIADGDVKD